jgi:hypothetical protein
MSTIVATVAPIAVDGPLPVAPAFSFFSVALDLDTEEGLMALGIDAGERIGGGVSLLPRPTDKPFGFDPCSAGTMREKEEASERTVRTFLPFQAYVPEFCSGMGVGPWEEFKANANAVLLATDAYAAERQFAFGLPMGDNPSLNDTNLVVLGSGVGPMEGLALLENAIGGTGRAGVIHATPGIATMWTANRALLWTGDVIRTVATRTPVIVGHGYIETDPDAAPGPTGDQEWAFATGPVFGWRGPLEELAEDIASTLDRSVNDVHYRAERDMLVGWDGVLQAGVLIDRSATP